MSALNPWFNEKLSLFQRLLQEKGLVGALFFHPIDIFYFTGSNLGNLLYVPSDGNLMLFTRRGFERLKDLHKDIPIYAYHSFKEVAQIINYHSKDSFGVIFDNIPFSYINNLTKSFNIPQEKLIDVAPLLRTMSMIKTPYEVGCIKHSAKALKNAFLSLNIRNTLNQTEIEISHFIDGKLKIQGSKGEIFHSPYHQFNGSMVLTRDSILSFPTEDITYGGFGLSASASTGSSNHLPIILSKPFIIDAVASINGFFCDITRTFVISNPSNIFKERYQHLVDILTYIESLLKPGNICSDIYHKTLAMVDKMGYKNNFMGYNGQHVPFIGHSVGVYVDEFPAIAPKVDVPLEENMVLAIEPKLYFNDHDSMGIENTYLITKDNPVSLIDLDNSYITIH